MITPIGEQLRLVSGSVSADIGTVAAVLRGLTVDGVELMPGFPADSTPPFGHGIILVPWPNRIAGGRWSLDGADQQLDLTEPDKRNAIHGLLRHTEYTVRERTDAAVTLGAVVYPQHGWPFLLDSWVRYELNPAGITVTHGVENLSAQRAPYAVGAHPFFRIGDVPVDELVLTVAAGTRFAVDAALIPTAELPVDGTDFDLRAGRRVGDVALDTAFGAVATVDGVSAWLTAPDGRTLALLQDADWGYLQVFTTRIFPFPGGPGLAVAMEPMTAPPDALNSGDGLRWLEPGERWAGSWGIRYSGTHEGE